MTRPLPPRHDRNICKKPKNGSVKKDHVAARPASAVATDIPTLLRMASLGEPKTPRRTEPLSTHPSAMPTRLGPLPSLRYGRWSEA